MEDLGEGVVGLVGADEGLFEEFVLVDEGFEHLLVDLVLG